MKKYLASIITIIILSGLYFYMNPNPQKVIENHLKNKYKEEFIVEVLGKREKTYEAIIYPKKYVGTSRENDSYYWGKGFAKGRKGGDTYGLVLLNESTNEFFLPKLKELFGENVLPVLDMGPSYVKNNFKEEMEALKKAYKLYPTASFEPISGGIYIFGRVESNEDREWYRKQIYEFVQFMKETGTFEYVSLEIFIIDERVLKDDMINNNEVLTILENNRKKLTRKEFFNLRNEILGEYPTKDVIKRNMLQINKGAYIENGIRDMFYQGIVFYKKLNSPKYIESNNLEGKKKLNYNNLEELQFEWEKF
ncbi:hypothetical protein [uncultured Fusobacterium sp.]|uniref:hypothetical protein n=1 Tax=uncultured Fusobacterium sp. TaxID=159267 RepID=UPI0015A664B3|nr:hypothetical protein [uncultured Fusobacterium sp.]